MIPQRAEQEFYDALNSILEKQPDEWVAIAHDQKELLVSPSDFAYYVKIRQQLIDQLGIAQFETDADGLPVVFFRGIRLKPVPLRTSEE